jgi:hypothetical protein
MPDIPKSTPTSPPADGDNTKPTATVVQAAGATDGVAAVHGAARSFRPAPPDHPIYNLVGRVASEWAFLEHMLDMTIWKLVGISDEKTGACITAQMMGVWPRFNVIQALLKSRSNEVSTFAKPLKAFNKICEDCRTVSEERNRILHDPWYLDDTDQQTAQRRSMPKSDPIYGLLDHDPSEITKTLERIGALSNRVRMLHNEILGALEQKASP